MNELPKPKPTWTAYLYGMRNHIPEPLAKAIAEAILTKDEYKAFLLEFKYDYKAKQIAKAIPTSYGSAQNMIVNYRRKLLLDRSLSLFNRIHELICELESDRRKLQQATTGFSLTLNFHDFIEVSKNIERGEPGYTKKHIYQAFKYWQDCYHKNNSDDLTCLNLTDEINDFYCYLFKLYQALFNLSEVVFNDNFNDDKAAELGMEPNSILGILHLLIFFSYLLDQYKNKYRSEIEKAKGKRQKRETLGIQINAPTPPIMVDLIGFEVFELINYVSYERFKTK